MTLKKYKLIKITYRIGQGTRDVVFKREVTKE